MAPHRTGPRPHLLTVLAAGVALLLAPVPPSAEAAGAPTLSAGVVQSAPDHWTDTLGDPVDYANAEDQILAPGAHQNTTPRIEGGQLRWTKTKTMDVALVFAGYGPSAFAIGREGIANPVDASRYTHLALRLRSEQRNAAEIWWDNCGPDRGRCINRTGFTVHPGWNTYVVPLQNGWAGQPVEVRLSVHGDGTPVQMALDWARLYEPGETVRVGYQGKALYWDADGDRANNRADNPGWGRLHSDGGTATFPADAFPPGTYRFYADGGPYSEPLLVDAPVPVFDAPHGEGGADYAASVTGDAWDFRQRSDVARLGNVDDVRFADGALHARNAAPKRGDPFTLMRMGAPIDTSRYHRLTVETTLAGPFNLSHDPGGGSHGRFLWRHVGQGTTPHYYNSKEIVVYPNIRRYTVDLHTDPREHISETDDAHRRGWQGHVDTFRYDPNEDPGPRRWTLSEISLRADHETSGDSFDIRWRDVSPAGDLPTTVSLYYDTVRGGTRHLIASGVAQRAGENRYRWDTRTVPNGRYWITAVSERANGTLGRGSASGPLVVRGTFSDPTVAAARIAGRDRVATAIALSHHAHPSGARAAVVAAHRGFPDAIAAAPLAAAAGGPVLLNPPEGLADAVAAELRRLGASTVYLMGGQAAQSHTVERDLAALPGVRVVRVVGLNRYATAARAASLAAERWQEAGKPMTGAIVASGANFPDALAAGPWAAAAAQPILLTRPGHLSPEAAEAVGALDIDQVAVVGGPGAVAEAVTGALAALPGLDGAVTRVHGADRYITAEQVARRAVAAGADGNRALVASGRDFPDALAAGPAAAAGGGVLLLTGQVGVPEPTRVWLAERRGAMAPLRVAGGPAAVSDAAVHHLLRAAGQ